MVRCLALCLTVCAALSIGQAALAQEEGSPSGDEPAAGILVLNQERLIAQSLYGQRIQRELEEASALLTTENRRIEAQLTEEELALTEQRATMAQEEFRALADAFDTRVEAIRAEQEAKARSLTQQADQAQTQFFERVAPILLELVRERDAAVLLDSRSVLLSADRVDVTEVAVATIDERLGDGGPEPIITMDPGTEAGGATDP